MKVSHVIAAAAMISMFTLAAREVSAADKLTQMRAAAAAEWANCNVRFPDSIKQAVARSACYQNAARPLRSLNPYPDLFDQLLALQALVAEQIQSGKITPPEGDYRLKVENSRVTTEAKNRSAREHAADGLFCAASGNIVQCF
jgi:hypothetical protein